MRVKKHASVLLLMALWLLTANSLLWAQGGPRGAITGTIKDETGALIPGAKIVVINLATGVTEREVTSSEAGSFTVPVLPVGRYKLEVTAAGFAKFEAASVEVRVTEVTSVVITMKLGPVEQVVTVTEAGTPVQLATAATGQTVGAETVSRLPLSTRNFLTLLTLSTGANTELFDSAALGRGAVTINVNGQRPVNNNYQLEGINANDFNLPILDNVPLPNPNTIQEFKTQTSLYDASQGRNGGGNIQVALKSGGSSYHGDGYGLLRNNVLNANDWFLNRSGRPRPVLRQGKFGGSFGGPIPLFHNFFAFGNYEGTRAASGAAAGTFFSTNIPVLPANRSEANLRAIYFPAGLPPGFTSLDPRALAFLNLPASKCPGFNDGTFCIPSLPGTPGLTGAGRVRLTNLTRAGLGVFRDDQFTISVDKQITSRDKATGRWFYSNFNSIQPFGGASSLPHNMTFPNSNRFLKLGWTRQIRNSMINDFRFGLNRFVFSRAPTENILLSDIGAVRANSGEFPAAYKVTVSGAFSLGTGVNDDRFGAFNTFVWGDDFSLSLGKHLFRAGVEINRYQLNRGNRFATRGNVNFGNTSPGAGGAGIPRLVGFQNFLLGRVTSTQGGAGFFIFYFRATDASAYFQDDWKISSRLTINAGLRWEGLSVAHEKFNFLSNFRGLNDGAPPPISIVHPEATARVGTPGVSNCTAVDCFDANNFAPRVGAAWDIFGDQRTVLRGGYGLYYQRTSNQPLLQSSGGLPFSQPISATAFSVGTQNPFPTIRPTSDFPLPFDQVVPRLVSFDAATGAPIFQTASGGPLSGFFFFPVRDFHAPLAHQWNVTLQREFFKGWVLEVGYVGTRGKDLIGTGRPFNGGQICTTSRPCVIPPNLAVGVTVPAGTPGVTANTDGSISITRSTEDNINARVPVRFLGLANSRGFFQEQAGRSTYHSLQTSVVHRWANGLYFQGAYTWSKSIDNSSGSAFGDELNGILHLGDLFDTRGNQRGPSDFDRTHRLVISYNYDLPIGKWTGVENRGIGKLLHGWAINGVTTFQSGTPYWVADFGSFTLQDTDFINGNRSTLAPGSTRSTVETSGSVRSRIDNYVNLGAFVPGGNCVNNQNVVVSCSDPSSTGFSAVGNYSRNANRGPFQQNWDFSVVKTTQITERVSVDFRTEFFNIWNNPSFQSPQAQGGSFGNYGIVDVSSGDSSILATVNRPRLIQFALFLRF